MFLMAAYYVIFPNREALKRVTVTWAAMASKVF